MEIGYERVFVTYFASLSAPAYSLQYIISCLNAVIAFPAPVSCLIWVHEDKRFVEIPVITLSKHAHSFQIW